MKFLEAEYLCAPLKHAFRTAGFPIGSSSHVLLRGVGDGYESYVDTLEDETYAEVLELLKERLSHELPATRIAEILRLVYGDVACDLTPAGKRLRIGAFPTCPRCGSQAMSSWACIDPPQRSERPAPPVTHHTWTKLSASEKLSRLEDALDENGVTGLR